MNDAEADLPEMRSALLSEAHVEALIRDLLACAQIHEVRLKANARQTAEDAAINLADAGALLTSGQARGLQIRYSYQNREYADTLLRTEGGFRLVRM